MNKQKGFSLVEGLLIILIVSVVSFAGYTVWNNNQEDEATETTQVSEGGSAEISEFPQVPSDIKEETFRTSQTGQKELVIQELGIVLEYELDDDEFVYMVHDSGQGAGSADKVVLTSRRLDIRSVSTDQYGCRAEEDGVGFIGFFTDPDADGSDSLNGTITKLERYPNAVRIGEKYYFVQDNYQSSCYAGDGYGGDNIPGTQELVDYARDSLRDANLKLLDS